MKFVNVWGGNSKLRGGNFPPPKGPEKNTVIGDLGWSGILDSGGARGPTQTAEVYEISKSSDFTCDF